MTLTHHPEATEIGADDGHRVEPGMQALVGWGLFPLALVVFGALIAVFA